MDIIPSHRYRKYSTKRVYVLVEIEKENKGVEYVILSESGSLNARRITMKEFCLQYKKLRTVKKV